MDILPSSLGSAILGSWISLRSCAKLDSACCSSASRAWYLSAVHGCLIYDRTSIESEAQCAWCVKRHINLQRVRISFDDGTNSSALQTTLGHCCESLTSLSLENIKSPSSERTLRERIRSIACVWPKLKEFEYCSSDAEPQQFIALTAHFPQLKSVTVYRCANLTSIHFREALKGLTKLHDLSIMWCGLDDEGLGHVLQECALLHTLCYRGHDLHGALAPGILHCTKMQRLIVETLDHGAVLALARHCPLLVELVISTKCDARQDAWRALFESARGLQRLRLTQCDHLRGAELGICACLTSAHITHCSQIDDDAVLALAKNNPFLSELYVDSQSLTYTLVLPLLCSTPSLRKIYLRNVPRAPLSTTTMDRLLEIMVRRQFPHLVEMNFCFV